MHFPKQLSFFIFFFFYSSQTFSQDISGEWIGEIYLKNKKGEYVIYFPVYFELTHDTLSNNIKGANVTKSGDTVTVDCMIEGVFDTKRQVYSLIESKVIAASIKSSFKGAVLNIFNVKFSKLPEETLEGTCSCIDPIKHPFCFDKLLISLKRYKE